MRYQNNVVYPRASQALLALIIFVTAACDSRSDVVPSSAPLAGDYILTNAKIYSVDTTKPWADAVVVDDNKIVFVGETETALTYVDDNTRVMDLEGRMVLPGLFDAHTHPGVAALAGALGVFLTPDMSVDDYLVAVKQYAANNPDVPVIAGFGYIPPKFGTIGPTKELLDSVVPDRPVFIISGFGHSAWVNSKALEILDISKDTPDPRPGAHFYRRNAEGAPTGFLVEGAAFWSHLGKLGLGLPEQFANGYRQVLPAFASAGITSLFDAGTPSVQENAFVALRELEDNGELTIRYNGSFYVIGEEDAADAVDAIQGYRNTYTSELLRFTGIKVSNDGQSPDPSLPHLLFDGEQLGKILTNVAEAGENMMIHATSPNTVTETLDGIAIAKAAVPDTESRFSIAHMDPIRKTDFQRFIDLGVIANLAFENYHLNFQHRALGVLEDNTLLVAPTRSMIDAGVVVVSSSDFPACGGPITQCTPFRGMEVALTRKGEGKTDGAALPPASESVSLEQSIYAYTMASAYQMGLEAELGSITVGKLADMIVLDQNLFEVVPHKIHETQVLVTMVNGRIVHNELR